MTSTGKFRVYPNPNRESPLRWCVHNGAIEIAVSEVQVAGLARTNWNLELTPSAWFEVDGKLLIIGSAATISAPIE